MLTMAACRVQPFDVSSILTLASGALCPPEEVSGLVYAYTTAIGRHIRGAQVYVTADWYSCTHEAVKGGSMAYCETPVAVMTGRLLIDEQVTGFLGQKGVENIASIMHVFRMYGMVVV